jgi:hypothetical protein
MTGRVYKSVYGALLGGCVAVAAMILPGAAVSHPAGRAPLTVVVLGKGATVASTPAGISCPGRCTARFASGTRVARQITEDGVFDGFAAKITYSVAGHLTPASAAGAAASAAGSYREDIVFKDATTTHTCTSNNQAWSSSKNGPIPQPKSLVVPAKKYSGPVIFSVSTAGTEVQNVTTYNAVPVACVPAVTGAPAYDRNFAIPTVTIRPDGSFSGQATQNGVFGNAPAKITYSVLGNFQGLNGSYATAAGSYREDITFTDSAGAHACTSNVLPFAASG